MIALADHEITNLFLDLPPNPTYRYHAQCLRSRAGTPKYHLKLREVPGLPHWQVLPPCDSSILVLHILMYLNHAWALIHLAYHNPPLLARRLEGGMINV